MAMHQAKTETGLVEGIPAGNQTVTIFRGIPYAAPPIGRLRWCEPQPAEPWSGVRKAYTFGSVPPQKLESNPVLLKENPRPFQEINEDCLYLNVWTPAETADSKLPVLFWIHGGANIMGYGHEMNLDGEAFAQKGVIFVTFNWRTNIFGWLVHPSLSQESAHHVSGNYGMLDQIAALQWVHRNIAAFGGDPDNITIGGESAGASSVQFLCCSPLVKGLFKNAIMESGCGFDLISSHIYLTLEEAEKGVDIQKAMGVSSIDEARQLSAMEIVRRVNQPEAAGAYLPMQVADGYVLPATVSELARTNRYAHVRYLIGYCADETHMYDYPVDRDQFIRDQEAEYGEYSADYLKLCDFLDVREKLKKHLKSRNGELLKTGVIVWANLLEKHGNCPAYVYCFDRDMPGDDSGSYHSAELWYVFKTLNRNWRPFVGADYELSNTMTAYWANFCKTGNPNGTGLPEWTPYTKERPLSMELGNRIGMKDFGENQRILFRKKFVLKQLPQK